MEHSDIKKVRLEEKFNLFADSWSPKIVGEINESYVKLVKLERRVRVASPRGRG